jgi:hypothetical protein
VNAEPQARSTSPSDPMAICSVLRTLLEATRSSRVTLRQKTPTTLLFPVTHEVLAPGFPFSEGQLDPSSRSSPSCET